VNTYRDFETVILLGRLEPPVEAIDDQLRCFGADGALPLVFASGGSCGWFPQQEGWYLRVDGTFEPARVHHHPDTRGAALLVQNREALQLQAIARIRAVSAAKSKRIVVLCSIPLPGMPVTDLMKWREFVTGVPDAIAGKLDLLRRAVRGSDGSPLEGMRLSVAGVFEDASHVFTSQSVAAEWRRGLSTDGVCELLKRLALMDRLDFTVAHLRKDGGGRPIPAVVFSKAQNAQDVAKRLWPRLNAEFRL